MRSFLPESKPRRPAFDAGAEGLKKSYARRAGQVKKIEVRDQRSGARDRGRAIKDERSEARGSSRFETLKLKGDARDSGIAILTSDL
jgi:hypothetical protein